MPLTSRQAVLETGSREDAPGATSEGSVRNRTKGGRSTPSGPVPGTYHQVFGALVQPSSEDTGSYDIGVGAAGPVPAVTGHAKRGGDWSLRGSGAMHRREDQEQCPTTGAPAIRRLWSLCRDAFPAPPTQTPVERLPRAPTDSISHDSEGNPFPNG